MFGMDLVYHIGALLYLDLEDFIFAFHNAAHSDDI